MTAAQTAPTPTELPPGRKWTRDDDTIFDNLISGGMTYEFVSQVLCRSVDALKARRKARARIAAGLGPKPGGGRIRPKDENDYMLGRRELPANDDGGYVARCLDAGGFAVSRRVHGAVYFAARERDGMVRTWRQP